ncbi:MAG: hypothetical protein LBJ59_08285 [Zoogloeaceae bacterium]|jgi:hypothetical protein|nr:hypothetical protein [Zoogloeaceae bacterium]
MNTPTPPRPDDDHAVERLLETLRRKEPARAEEDDLPLLTDIVRAEHSLRARTSAARHRPSDAAVAPSPEESPAPPADTDNRAALAAEAALQALEARVQGLPDLIANALRNALPGITAEILKGIQEPEDRGPATEDSGDERRGAG